jgi:hypothetical protein
MHNVPTYMQSPDRHWTLVLPQKIANLINRLRIQHAVRAREREQ